MAVLIPMAMVDVEALPTVCSQRPALITYIATKEGYYAGHPTLPQELFNPCSLVYHGQPGAVRDHTGFARFKFEVDGFSACHRDVASKLSRGISLKLGWNYLDRHGRMK